MYINVILNSAVSWKRTVSVVVFHERVTIWPPAAAAFSLAVSLRQETASWYSMFFNPARLLCCCFSCWDILHALVFV